MISPKQHGRTEAFGDLPAGAIGLANRTETYRAVTINQTTADQTLVLPDPTDTSVVFALDVMNIGSEAFSLNGLIDVPAATSQRVSWTGSAWSIIDAVPQEYVDQRDGLVTRSDLPVNWRPEDYGAIYVNDTVSSAFPDVDVSNGVQLKAVFFRKFDAGSITITLPSNVTNFNELDVPITTITVGGDSAETFMVFFTPTNLFWVKTSERVLTGTSSTPPANSAYVGQLYLNTNTREIFKSTSLTTWDSVTNRLVNADTVTTLTSDHNNTVLQRTNSAGDANFTINDVFPVGGICTFVQRGTEMTQFVAGAGVTIRHPDGHTAVRAQNSIVSIMRGTEVGEYFLSGDTA